MKSYPLLSLFLFSLHLNFFCQAYQYPEKYDRSYDLKPLEALSGLRKKALPGLTLNQSNEYRVETMFNTQCMFDNNDVYLNWMEVEAYLYKIIDTLAPDEALKAHTILVFLTKFDSPYAFSYDNGLLFVNIGAFAEFPDEGCLAAALAAEIYKIRNEKHFLSWMMLQMVSNNNYRLTKNSPWSANGPVNNFDEKWKKYIVNQKMTEFDADSSAIAMISKAGYNSRSLRTMWKIREQINKSYELRMTSEELTQYRKYQSESAAPAFAERLRRIERICSKMPIHNKAFMVDSSFYMKMHKIAKQEIKRKLFENGYYYTCLRHSFADYLTEPGNLKNNYWLLESLRRILYVDSTIAKKGFLTAEFRDAVTLATNRSVLYIPEALVYDSIARAKLLEHPLFANSKKPFHTTEEAFLYFADQFSQSLSETELSRALYLYSKNDKKKSKEHLEKYLASGIGLYKEFADHWMTSGTPDLNFNKRLILFDNTDNSNNYYLTMRKKQVFNTMIRQSFAKDSASNHLILINELYASQPKLLNQYQKLENLTMILCDVPETKEEGEPEPQRTHHPLPNKHLFVLAPEWYNWFTENKFGKICVDKVSYTNYLEGGPLDENEFESFYQVIDLNLAKSTSRYQQASELKFKRKQTTSEIVKELRKFLAKSDETD